MRSLADARDPTQLTAGDCTSEQIFTVHEDTSEDEFCRVMEEHQVRRVPVVDDENCCCGIVSQADIARQAPAGETAEVVRDISQPAH